MIIIEAAYFVTFCFFTTFSLSGLGQILVRKINKNFFESVFYGFIVAAFFITLIHFFLKINIYFSLIILSTGFLLGLKSYFSKIKLKKKQRKLMTLRVVHYRMIIQCQKNGSNKTGYCSTFSHNHFDICYS